MWGDWSITSKIKVMVILNVQRFSFNELLGFKTAPANRVSRTSLDNATAERLTVNIFLSFRSCPFACLSYSNSVFRKKVKWIPFYPEFFFLCMFKTWNRHRWTKMPALCVFFSELTLFSWTWACSLPDPKIKKKKFGPWGVNRTCPNETVAKPLVSFFKKNVVKF